MQAWEKQFDNIQKEYRKILKRHATVSKIPKKHLIKQDKEHICKSLIPKASDPDMFKPTLKGTKLEFPIQRVGRISNYRASVILTKYSHYIARSAFDRDVGKEIDS